MFENILMTINVIFIVTITKERIIYMFLTNKRIYVFHRWCQWIVRRKVRISVKQDFGVFLFCKRGTLRLMKIRADLFSDTKVERCITGKRRKRP